MRIINSNHRFETNKLLRDIGVDPYGIKIMLPKATNLLVLLKKIDHIAYVRFASVYMNFQDLKDFKDVVKEVKTEN